MKTLERQAARFLRGAEGRPIKEIAGMVRVSPSSVSLWVRDIGLSREQLDSLRARNPAVNGQLKGSRANAARARERRIGYQEEGRAVARRAEPLHAAGCMLFWAEGGKHRNTVRFTNSEPEMLRLFLLFLRTYFAVPDEKVRLWCNLHADHGERQWEIEQHWLDALGLPRSCLTRSTVNSYSRASMRKRRNMLPYGTCRLSVSSTRIIQSIYGSIQEYAGFVNPTWLDCTS